MKKIEVILAKAKKTKGAYVYEEELGEGGKPAACDAAELERSAETVYSPQKNTWNAKKMQ
jgi:hypothetical protein